MSTKKVVDYIIVSRLEEHSSFLQRISDGITTLESKIIESENFLEQERKQIEFHEAVKIEFKKLKLFKVDETYDTNESFSMNNWIGGLRYKHPLAPYNPWKKEKTINLTDIKNIQINYDDIDQKLKDQIALDKKNNEELITLKSKLNELKNNPDPILNKAARSSFENEIFELLGRGYVLQGGVSSSLGHLCQAMIKYEDE
ncbi:hypothetical protein [Lacinutrix jangbogonensis]|uniref:hypothetical protein n=1 Tax=Lacinutrix jangbogonensis TaxID=1469557 RepID=UPI00053D1F91|nr:hypothetical protein [Lacinutrix jangbogonensis]